MVRHLTAVCTETPLQNSSKGSISPQTVVPAGGEQRLALRRKIRQPSRNFPGASVDPVSRIPGFLFAAESSISESERPQHSIGANCMHTRAVTGADHVQLQNSRFHGAEARMTPNVTTVIEPSRVLPYTPRTPTSTLTRLPHATLTAARLSAASSLTLRHRLDPVGAVANSELLESSISPHCSGLRTIKIGIEAEFYLVALNKERNHTTLEGFAAILARYYNQEVPLQHPRMQDFIRNYEYNGPYTKWCLVKEDSLLSFGVPCKSCPFYRQYAQLYPRLKPLTRGDRAGITNPSGISPVNMASRRRSGLDLPFQQL